jgi:hypothetical protein
MASCRKIPKVLKVVTNSEFSTIPTPRPAQGTIHLLADRTTGRSIDLQHDIGRFRVPAS